MSDDDFVLDADGDVVMAVFSPEEIAMLDERRRYRAWVLAMDHGLYGGWGTVANERGQVSEYTVQNLLADLFPSAPVAVQTITRPTRHPKTAGCGGKGGFQSFDTWYDCGGCAGCRPESHGAYWIAWFFWRAGVWREHAEYLEACRGMELLAQIGRAVEAALSPGAGVGQFLHDTVRFWHGVYVGRWYRVVGRQGRARDHHGKIGYVTEIYDAEAGAPYGRGRYTTQRARLRGVTGDFSVACGQLGPHVPDQSETRWQERVIAAAAETMRTGKDVALQIKKGDTVWVARGKGAGRYGVVFWVSWEEYDVVVDQGLDTEHYRRELRPKREVNGFQGRTDWRVGIRPSPYERQTCTCCLRPAAQGDYVEIPPRADCERCGGTGVYVIVHKHDDTWNGRPTFAPVWAECQDLRLHKLDPVTDEKGGVGHEVVAVLCEAWHGLWIEIQKKLNAEVDAKINATLDKMEQLQGATYDRVVTQFPLAHGAKVVRGDYVTLNANGQIIKARKKQPVVGVVLGSLDGHAVNVQTYPIPPRGDDK